MRKSQLKQYIFVIRELTGREIKRKYSRSKLGIVWSVLNPLLSMIILSLIFSQMFKRSIHNYPIYYLCGSVLWSLFTTGTNTSMTALVDNKNMLIKVKIPMQVFVISRVYTALVNFGYSLIAFVPIIIFYKVKISAALLFLPVIIIAMLLFVLGFSYTLSIGYVFFGDLKHLYSILLTLWMYMSAIFYPISSIKGVMHNIINNNPIYQYIYCMRCVVYEAKMPPVHSVVAIFAWGLAVYVIGTLIFRINKNNVIQKL